MKINLRFGLDTATPLLAAERAVLQDTESLHRWIGHRVVNVTADHLREWEFSHPNKLGGKRTGYWSTIAAMVTPETTLTVTAQSATMTLDGEAMPGVTRAFGPVTIRPGTRTPGVKNLAIPAAAESHGLRPREMDGLVPLWTRQGIRGLKTAPEKKSGGKKTNDGIVMFWFKKSVTQPQDRSLLPDEAKWAGAAQSAAVEWVKKQIESPK